MRWGELGGYVDQLPGSLYRLRSSAATVAGHDCRLAPPPLTAAAAECHLTPQTI